MVRWLAGTRWRVAVATCGMLLGLAACGQSPQSENRVPVTLGDKAGPAPPMIQPPSPQPQPPDELATTHWPPARVGSGHAEISCERDDDSDEPRRLDSLEFFSLAEAMLPCQASGLVRLQYRGRIDPGFTQLMERVAGMAERMDLPERILDIDSAGGQVEEAILAGDVIAGSRWLIRVREDAVCHSSCVLVLASGDNRDVDGRVGVHRLMRDRSKATSRAELNEELRTVNAQVREYLERHGVALTVADLMMTVPNRRLRMLTADELKLFGLQGRNAVQDDLERIVARRECGEDFVRRRDAFQRQFESACGLDERPWEEVVRCGIDLRPAYGFPDARCPNQTPLARAERRLQLEELRIAQLQQAAEDEKAATEGASKTAPRARLSAAERAERAERSGRALLP